MTSSTEISVEHVDRFRIVRIDRQARRNALDAAALDDIATAISRAGQSDVRAIVLTGEGTASFSSGMDLKAMRETDADRTSQAVERFRSAFDDPDRPPIIAAVNGNATGGGFEIVLQCDLVVAAHHAEFSLPEVRHGLVPGGGATLLPCRIPVAVAIELGITGAAMPAERAYQLGLVNRVSDDIVDESLSIAEQIARAAPNAVRRTRHLMQVAWRAGAERAWADTVTTIGDPDLRPEMLEGIAAFIEKRPPRW